MNVSTMKWAFVTHKQRFISEWFWNSKSMHVHLNSTVRSIYRIYHSLLHDLVTPRVNQILWLSATVLSSSSERFAFWDKYEYKWDKMHSRKRNNSHDSPPGSSPAAQNNKMSYTHIWPYALLGFYRQSAMPLGGHPDFQNTYSLSSVELIASP